MPGQGKSAANRRHWNLEKQLIQVLHGTEEKAHDSKGVGVNWDSDTAGSQLGSELVQQDPLP